MKTAPEFTYEAFDRQGQSIGKLKGNWSMADNDASVYYAFAKAFDVPVNAIGRIKRTA